MMLDVIDNYSLGIIVSFCSQFIHPLFLKLVCHKLNCIIKYRSTKKHIHIIIKDSTYGCLFIYTNISSEYVIRYSIKNNIKLWKGYHDYDLYVRYACKHGTLDMLRYCSEHLKKYSFLHSEISLLVAQFGHLHILIYWYFQGYQWNKNTCAMAAKYGHLDCLKYLHKNGCDWDENVYKNAITYNHLDCLKYAYQEKCPCSIEIMEKINQVYKYIINQ